MITDFQNEKNGEVLFAENKNCDFGFIIFNNQLEEWILRNACNYICPLQGERNNSSASPNILANYFSALNMWEENDNNIVDQYTFRP